MDDELLTLLYKQAYADGMEYVLDLYAKNKPATFDERFVVFKSLLEKFSV